MDKELYRTIIRTLVDKKLIEYFNIQQEATDASKGLLIQLGMNAKKIVEPKKIETSDENKDVSSQSIKKKSSFGIKKPIPDKADIPKKENIIESLVVSQNSGFEITDEGLYYNSGKGVERSANVDTAISSNGRWLSSRIPAPNFDIDCSGNIRKTSEAESFYICAIIVGIINDEEFNIEFESVLNDYNFSNMTGSKDFKSLLNDWQNLESLIINVISSAAKIKMTDQKKDSEAFLRSGLLEEEIAQLRDLELSVRAINYLYSIGSLGPENVKLLTKLERLEIIAARDEKVNELIRENHYSNLFKLTNLSSEYISPIKKKKIEQLCYKELKKVYESDKLYEVEYGEFDIVLDKLKKRALKAPQTI
jgi:hypothetical protein